jgi:hypothetical protein
MEPTAERARQLVRYEPDTGHFYRRVRLAQRHSIGDRADFVVAGGNLVGYRRIAFDSHRYLAHRIAWLMFYGEMPSGQIDHINGNRGDNRIVNLRDVDRTTNVENIRKPRCHSKSGLLGVQPWGKRWRARIQVRGKHIHLGSFATKEDAHVAYIAAKRLLHAGCTI